MIGIIPSDIPDVQPTVVDPVDAEARFRAVARDWIDDRYETPAGFKWADHWHWAPYDLLSKAFSYSELIRLWMGCCYSSKLDDHIQEHDEVIWKVKHSLWRYGADRSDDRFFAGVSGLRRIAIDLPDFDVRITHTRYINTAAWATHGRDERPLYLDAPFGVLLYYKGKHALTIGFAFSAYGILVAQVQLREKRGNRFLYKLPMPYLEFSLDLLARAFLDDRMYLVTGASTVDGIRRAYTKAAADRLTPDIADRIARFYDQPLGGYERTGQTVRCASDDGRVFAELMPGSAAKAA